MIPKTHDCPLLPLSLTLTQQMCQLFQVTRFLSAFGRTFLPFPSVSSADPQTRSEQNEPYLSE